MSLSRPRDYIANVVPVETIHQGNRVCRNVRRAPDVIAAAEVYLCYRKVSCVGMNSTDMAQAMRNELRRIGIISLVDRGQYNCVSRSRRCLIIVNSGERTKSLRNLRGYLPWR